MKARFPDDHPLEVIRGTHKFSLGELRRVVRDRVQFLDERVLERSRVGLDHFFHVNEMKALTQLLESYELMMAWSVSES